MAGANPAVRNVTGMFYHSKIVDPYASIVNNAVTWKAESETWTEEANVTTTDYTISLSEAGPAKGSKGQKIAVAVGWTPVATTCFAYNTITSTDLSGYDAVTFYIRANAAIPSGDLYLVLGTDATTVTTAYSSRTEKLLLPAIPKTTMTGDTPDNGDEFDEDRWVRVLCKLAAPSSDTAITSVGFYWAGADPGAITIYVQGLRAMHSLEGRTGFSISETVDEIDVSDYESKFTREYQTSYSAWTCSTEGHKEGPPPLEKGREYVIAMVETDTVGQCFIGNALYTGFNPSGTFSEAVMYPYTLRGNGYVQKPLA